MTLFANLSELIIIVNSLLIVTSGLLANILANICKYADVLD